MVEKIGYRKKAAVILIVTSTLQLVGVLTIFVFTTRFTSYSDTVKDFEIFMATFPQAVTMMILSILVYLASPWRVIYIIYYSIWVVVFAVGSAWTALLMGFFGA